MAHHEQQSTSAIDRVLEIVTEHGLEAMKLAIAGMQRCQFHLQQNEQSYAPHWIP